MLLTILVIILIITILAALLSLIVLIILFYTRVPFIKTPPPVIRALLKEIKISSIDTIYDLGCGDASALIAIEKATGAKTIGFELSPIAFFRGLLNIWLKKSKTKILYGNFYKKNLEQADVIYCFLLDSVMEKVGQQLDAQLRPGAKVISYAFPIPQWKPIKTIMPFTDTKKTSKLYIYQR